MEYVDKLLRETEYLNYVEKLERLEADRVFCRHGLGHLLDTARIAWIRVLEAQTSRCGQKEAQTSRYGQKEAQTSRRGPDRAVGMAPGFGEELLPEKEIIYLAALLHDLGRIQEYEEGVPHQRAGAALARQLLQQIGYPQEKTELIAAAIESHRGGAKSDREVEADRKSRQAETPGQNAALWAEPLGQLLSWADKRSRNCFACKAQKACKWEAEKQNRGIGS